MNKSNYINIGDKGTFTESGQVKTSPHDVDEIFRYLKVNDISDIVIHFHGGLVNERDGMDVAKMMTSVYSAVGVHPITFVWETGLMETIKERITTINKTKIFKWILKKTAKVVAKKYGITIDGKGGYSIKDRDIEKELLKDHPFAFIDQMDEDVRGGLMYNSIEELEMDKLSFENEIRREAQNDPEFEELLLNDNEGIALFKSDIQSDIKDKDSKGFGTFLITLGKVTWRVVKRFIQKRDHGGMATIFEELLRELYLDDLGAWVWSGMKLKAEEMWMSNDGRTGDDLRVGRYFFGQLEDYIKENPHTKVNLVGHSAGSIIICHFLNLIVTENKNCSFETISLLAPACRVDLFNKHIVNNSSRFNQFRLFTMSDYYETRDCLLGKIYPRSLLYLISGFLENGFDEYLVGLERHIKAEHPYNVPELQKAHAFIYDPNKDRIVLSLTDESALEGMKSESKKHGDFDNDINTQESLQSIIKK